MMDVGALWRQYKHLARALSTEELVELKQEAVVPIDTRELRRRLGNGMLMAVSRDEWLELLDEIERLRAQLTASIIARLEKNR